MPEGTGRGPEDEPERPAAQPTEPLGAGSWPTEPVPPASSPGEPPPPGPPPPGDQPPGDQGHGQQPPWSGQQAGQSPYGPYGQYGQYGQYGYPPRPQTDSTAIAALVTAIAGFFVCFPLGGVVALILALSAERRIKDSGGRLSGLDQARIAKIIAIVELALTALGVVLFALLIAFSNQSGASIGAL